MVHPGHHCRGPPRLRLPDRRALVGALGRARWGAASTPWSQGMVRLISHKISLGSHQWWSQFMVDKKSHLSEITIYGDITIYRRNRGFFTIEMWFSTTTPSVIFFFPKICDVISRAFTNKKRWLWVPPKLATLVKKQIEMKTGRIVVIYEDFLGVSRVSGWTIHMAIAQNWGICLDPQVFGHYWDMTPSVLCGW